MQEFRATACTHTHLRKGRANYQLPAVQEWMATKGGAATHILAQAYLAQPRQQALEAASLRAGLLEEAAGPQEGEEAQ